MFSSCGDPVSVLWDVRVYHPWPSVGEAFFDEQMLRFGRRFDNIAFVAPAVERMHEPAERRDGREWARFYTVPTPAR